MKKSKFDIRVGGSDDILSSIKVDGYVFDYEGFNFFVHKSLDYSSEWTVSEAITGRAVCTSLTRKSAISNLKFLVDAKRDVIENGIKKAKEYEEKHNTAPSS